MSPNSKRLVEAYRQVDMKDLAEAQEVTIKRLEAILKEKDAGVNEKDGPISSNLAPNLDDVVIASPPCLARKRLTGMLDSIRSAKIAV
ncbi:hypothetical protein SH449x_000136 [Pirellulaceae bacterium SH449]